jgi:hypothetical protein
VKKSTAILASLIVTALALGFAACGDKVPSCEEAMNHLYAQGCALTVNGTPISQADAISGCEETRTTAANCGCAGPYGDALDCLASVVPGNCEGCAAEFDAYNSCMSACG